MGGIVSPVQRSGTKWRAEAAWRLEFVDNEQGGLLISGEGFGVEGLLLQPSLALPRRHALGASPTFVFEI